MIIKERRAFAFVLLFIPILLMPVIKANDQPLSAELKTIQLKAPEIEFITADELKRKLGRNEAIMIIDVRASTHYADSANKIKGAIHVKLRRLKDRLSFAPLKDAPRTREIVTYCACPNDESALAAAQVLIDSGFKRVRALKGGWQEWLRISGPVEQRPKSL